MFRTNLKLEALGSRDLPSAGMATPAPAILHQHYALAGHGSGSYTRNLNMPDAGSKYQLTGTAQLADLGQVSVSGKVGGTGFTQHGHAYGTLTFTNAKGSVTLELTGVPEQNGFSPPPPYFRYRITAGTGAYKNLQEHGTLRIDLVPPVGTAKGSFRVAI
jgi:hypothetical protein